MIIVPKNKIKHILGVCLLLWLLGQTVQAQTLNRLTRHWKYGLSGAYILSEKIEFFNVDADKKTVDTLPVSLYGIFAERIYFDEFGFGVTLLKGSKSVEFDIDTAQDSVLKLNNEIYHLSTNFIAYLNKNRRTGVLFGFEAALGFYQVASRLTADTFAYVDKVSGGTGTVTDLDKTLNYSFITSTFLVKMDLRFKNSGIKLSAGLVTGGSFEKTGFDVPNFGEQAVIGIRNSFDRSPVITLDIYAFD